MIEHLLGQRKSDKLNIQKYTALEKNALDHNQQNKKENYSAINIYLGIVFCGRPALLEGNGSKLI